ncbi:hypothetical protein M9Y10_024497 [Tritrichomonas musculus]|uniref:Uncharacterized protein n=1 Tax=Tritrichomonas musculus TaxID=1915356 RepID=A0ABR2HC58_9EUKA
MQNSDNQILFINRFQNYAWVRTDKGTFVTADGNVYEFDLIGQDFRSRKQLSQDDVMQSLTEISKNSQPSKTLDKAKILQAYNLVDKIDKNSKMLVAQFANDAGQRTLSSISNGKFITLATSGDRNGSVDCEEVKQILETLHETEFYTWESFGEPCSIEQIKQRNPIEVNIFDDIFF